MSDIEDRANDARRLGLMIVESRTGQALAAAIPHLREAADLFGREQRSMRRAECLIDLGRVHVRLGHPVDGATVFNEALALVEDESDLTQAIIAASEGGLALLAHRDHPAALAMLRRAEALADKANDHLQLAQVRHDLALCHLAHGDAAAARQAAEAALKTFTAFRKVLQRTACIERLAEASHLVGEHAEAATRYAEAAAIQTELGRHADADAVLARWADSERDRGAFDEAIRIDRERVANHEATGNRGLQSHALLHLGMVQAKRQDHDGSLVSFRRALELCEASDDRAGQAQANLHIGAALVRSGDAAEGLRRLQLAVELATACGDHRTEEEALAAVVRQCRASKDDAGAMLHLRRWAEVLRRTGDRAQEIQALGELATVGRQTGQLNSAEEALRELIAACAAPEHHSQLVDAHHHLGVLMARRGDLAGALDHLRRAFELLGDQPAWATRAQLLYRIGNLELRLERPADALRHLQQALAANPDEKLRPRILVDLGNAQANLGQEDVAVELFEQAAKVAEKLGDMRATTMIRRQAGGLRK
jgi:tetratricopeptide (TPR) repeat protein